MCEMTQKFWARISDEVMPNIHVMALQSNHGPSKEHKEEHKSNPRPQAMFKEASNTFLLRQKTVKGA